MRRKMKRGTRVLIVILIVVIFAAAFFSLNIINDLSAGKAVSSGNPNNSNKSIYVPLNSTEMQTVTNAILLSPFAQDIPNNNPISLTFYIFQNKKKVWQNRFIIGGGQILQSGVPGISITMDSKYILELNSTNLCDVIQKANKNGDLGFSSKYSTTILVIKYAKLLNYKNCFGI